MDGIVERRFPQLSPKNKDLLKWAGSVRVSLFYLLNVPRDMFSDGHVINLGSHAQTVEAVFMQVREMIRKSDIRKHVTADQWKTIEDDFLSTEIFRAG